jgi:hypothetical protein
MLLEESRRPRLPGKWDAVAAQRRNDVGVVAPQERRGRRCSSGTTWASLLLRLDTAGEGRLHQAMEFFDPSGEIEKHGGKLPHWQQGEAMQFVTYRLGDAMPQAKLRVWREERRVWMERFPKPWSREVEQEYYRRFHGRLEEWLDAGMGSCIFRDPSNREVLETTLMFDEGIRADHQAWVIMPNHVHMIFSPKVEIELLLKTWKGLSSRRIKQGEIWQKGYRDTLIRNAGHFANAVRYVRRNPAKLRAGEFTLWEGPRALEVR